MIRIRIVLCLLIVLMLAAPALPAAAISDVCPNNNGGAHAFNDGGSECIFCHQTCDHAVWSYHDINYTYTDDYPDYPDIAHTEHRQDDVKICDACGFVIDPGMAKSIPTPHRYFNGQCDECGHVCTHSTYNTETYKCGHCRTPCPHAEYDTTTHLCKACQFPCPHAEYDATTHTCKACGLLCDHTVSSYHDINFTHADDYTYDQNERHTMRWQNHAYVCDTCGFVIDPGEAQSRAVLHSYSHGQCEECDHVCTHTRYTDYICDYCKTPCPHDAYNETTHACAACGFPCPHPDGKIKSAQSDPRYDVISTGGAYDSSVHVKSWTPYDYCEQCGMEVATYDDEFVFEAHAFGADGHCTRCGFICAHERLIRVKNAGGGYDVTCETCGMVCPHTDKTKEIDIRYTPASGDAHLKSVKIVRSCALCRYVTSIEETEASEAHVFEPDIAGRNRCALCRQYEDAPLDGDVTFLPNASMVFADGAETVASGTGDAYGRLRVDVGACEDEYQFAVYELPEEWKGRPLFVLPPEGECVIAASDGYLYIARKGGDAISFYISLDAVAEQHGYQPVGDAPISDDAIMNGVFAPQ